MDTISKIDTAGEVMEEVVEVVVEVVEVMIRDIMSSDQTRDITKGGESRVVEEVEEDRPGRREPSVGRNIGR